MNDNNSNNNAYSLSIKPYFPWLIWGLATLFYAYEFFLQVSPSVMVPDLMAAFKVNAATLGNLAALYFYAYAIMQIPAGIFLDTFGPRKLLTVAVATCICGVLLFASAHSLWHAQIGRLLIGFGSSFATIGSFKLASSWFSPNRFAFISGLTVMIGMLGAIFGGAPLAILVDHVGWRASLVLFGIIGIVLCALIWLIVRDCPMSATTSTSTIKKTNQYLQQDKLISSLSSIFKKKQNWLTAIYGGLIFAPTSAFAALWGVPYLMADHHLSNPIAASAISMIFLGWAFGSPFWGWFSDLIYRRKPSMYTAAIGSFITIICILYFQLPMTILYFVLFLFGFLSAGFLPAFTIMREINSLNTNATALGFMNMMNMVGGAVLQPFIGFILDHYWQGKIINDIHIFPLHGYHVAMITLPISLFIALLLMPFIQETHCSQEDAT